MSWFLFELELNDKKFVATNGPFMVNITKSDQKGSIGRNKFLVIWL